MRLVIIVTISVLALACTSSSEKPAGNQHSGHNAVDHNAHSPATNAPAPAANTSTTHDHTVSSPGASAAPFELQFLDSMIAHHRGAVDMAMLAEGRSAHAEVKDLAANIINEQEREVAKMAEWRNGWFDGKPEAINMEFPGMKLGMGGMDMGRLASLKGHDFDMEFLRQMIPHHEGAIEMSKAVKAGRARTEIQELAEDIIASQEAEVKQMKEWVEKWK